MTDAASPRRLSLDHLTAAEATPEQLIEIAAEGGCGGACILASPMTIYPQTAASELVKDAIARRATLAASRRTGVAIDWVHPFLLSGRRPVSDMRPRLEAAAALEAHGVGVMIYDTDEARRAEQLGELSGLAAGLGLKVALEFFPASRLRSLDEALALVAAARVENLGLCVDVMHLLRSGGSVADLMAAPAEAIVFGQLCDGPRLPSEDIEAEAMRGRLDPGDGEFPLEDFLRALPADVRLGVEVPNDQAEGDARTRGLRAIASAHRVMARAFA